MPDTVKNKTEVHQNAVFNALTNGARIVDANGKKEVTWKGRLINTDLNCVIEKPGVLNLVYRLLLMIACKFCFNRDKVATNINAFFKSKENENFLKSKSLADLTQLSASLNALDRTLTTKKVGEYDSSIYGNSELLEAREKVTDIMKHVRRAKADQAHVNAIGTIPPTIYSPRAIRPVEPQNRSPVRTEYSQDRGRLKKRVAEADAMAQSIKADPRPGKADKTSDLNRKVAFGGRF